MTQQIFSYLIGALLGVAVPLWAVMAATGEEQRALGLIVAPFGWPRLLVVQLAATLPICLLGGAVLGRGRRGTAWGWGVLGACTACLTAAHAAFVGALGNGGFTSGVVIRSLWCLGLQLPWCLLGRSLASGRAGRPRWPALALAGAVAVAPPALYARYLVESQSQRAEEWLLGDRLVQARGVIEGLAGLGSSRPLAGILPAEVLPKLREVIRSYAAAVATPLPDNVHPRKTLNWSKMLRALGRPIEAERQLASLPDTSVEAVLLRADLLQDQKRWQESNRHYRRALALLAGAPAADQEALRRRVQAYDGIAFNARELRAFAEAETVYRQALDMVPEARAHFHFQLGRHYHHGGRSGQALEQFRTAVRLDPGTYAAQVRLLIAEISARTPGCLLRWRGP